MSIILAIVNREIRSYFLSPIAYGLMAGFLIVSGFFFYISLSMFIDISIRMLVEAQREMQIPPPINVNLSVVNPLMGNFSFLSLLILPMITMRLIAEEKKLMTIELLLTSPVTSFQLIMGKFLSGFIFYVILLAPTVVYFIILKIFGNPEITPVVIGYLGLLLFAGVLISIGLLVSSFTENQLIAVALTLSIGLLLWIVDWPAGFINQPFISSILSYISIPAHFNDFIKGVLDSKHIFYFISIITLCLYLTHRSLESLRWRS